MSMNRAEHMAYKISFKWIELISWSRAERVCVGGADGRDGSIGQWAASSLLWFIFPQDLSKNCQHINQHRTRIRPTLHLLRHPIILCRSFHYCLLTTFSAPPSARNKTLNTHFPLLHICPMKNWTEVLYCCTLNSTCFIQRRRRQCEALMCQTRLSGFVCCKYLNISIDIPPGPAPGEHAARRWKAGARQLLCRYDADWQLGLCCFEPPGRKKKQKKKIAVNFSLFPPFLLFQAEGLFCGYEPLSWWQ